MIHLTNLVSTTNYQKITSREVIFMLHKNGTLHGIRTHNLRYRKPMLYPVELTGHIYPSIVSLLLLLDKPSIFCDIRDSAGGTIETARSPHTLR